MTNAVNTQELTLIDFYADWCGPCQAMSPLIDRLKTEVDIKVEKINIEKQPDLAQLFQVRSIPTFVLMKNDEVLKAHIGAMSYARLVEFAKV